MRTSRPWRRAKTDEGALKPRCCDRRDCPPAERRCDARMRRSPVRSPGRPDTESAKSNPTASANPADNRRAHNRSACARSAARSGCRVGVDRPPPRCGGVTERDRYRAASCSKGCTSPLAQQYQRFAGTSPGDRVQQNESHHRHVHSRSSRKGSWWDPPGSLACDRHAEGTAPSIGRG